MKDERIEDWIRRRQERRSQMLPKTIFQEMRSGNMGALSSGITLIESRKKRDRQLGNELISMSLPFSGNAMRIGITGVPGVGKSTFIETFGKMLLSKGMRVAVLAIDPTSAVSKGSILGDKTRMQELSGMENVFIRPSPAGSTLGGVAQKTRESMVLCEAAGFDVVLIETVGVGQSETMVKSMVDFFLLLMLSGAGDELQGIKKGIMEMADALVITKADGENVQPAKLAARQYKNALHLFPPNPNGWIPKVFTCSAHSGANVSRALEVIESFFNHTRINGSLQKNRRAQDKRWLTESLKELIISDFFTDQGMLRQLDRMEDRVLDGRLTSFAAAQELFQMYKNHGKKL